MQRAIDCEAVGSLLRSSVRNYSAAHPGRMESLVINTQASNNERELINLLTQIALEENYTLSRSFTDWVVEVINEQNDKILIFGYDFGLNPSSSAEIARDKAATSYLLSKAGIPCLEERVIFRPDWAKYTGQSSAYALAFQAFEEFNGDVVCKNNKGTGGVHVYRARSYSDLEQALLRIFAVHYACAVSPFIDIDDEVRVILVDRAPKAVFAKQRPSVKGDGMSTVATLIAKQLPDLLAGGQLAGIAVDQLLEIPSAGQRRCVNWRHNLGQGAAPVFEVEHERRQEGIALALAAVSALNLRAASIDVFWSNNQPGILEVNSGIMVENLARSGDTGRKMALETYRALISAAWRHG